MGGNIHKARDIVSADVVLIQKLWIETRLTDVRIMLKWILGKQNTKIWILMQMALDIA